MDGLSITNIHTLLNMNRRVPCEDHDRNFEKNPKAFNHSAQGWPRSGLPWVNVQIIHNPEAGRISCSGARLCAEHQPQRVGNWWGVLASRLVSSLALPAAPDASRTAALQ